MSVNNSADNSAIDTIDALLPQTQCTLCGYDGCKPYATAIANKEAPLDRCLPGGVRVMRQLGQQLGVNVQPLEKDLAIRTRAPAKVIIREESCIGCTKCIQACPTDAIIGAAKKMHRVLIDDCTGCELCIDPCPVDCIDIIPATQQHPSEGQLQQAAREAREHFHHRQARLALKKEKIALKSKLKKAGAGETSSANKSELMQSIGLTDRIAPLEDDLTITDRQAIIASALAKSRLKRKENKI